MNIPAAAQTWNPSDDTLEAPPSLPAGFEEACLADKDARAHARIPFEEILHDGRDCLLQMANVQFIDSTGIGHLIQLQKKLRAIDRQLVLLATSQVVQRALKLIRLEGVFATAPDQITAEQLLQKRDRELLAGVDLNTPAPARPLRWQGEITAANADEVWNIARSYLTNAAEASQPEVIIDLSSVQLRFGSDGTDRKLAQYHGTKLIFQHVQPAVQNVIHLSRMEEFLLGQIRPRR